MKGHPLRTPLPLVPTSILIVDDNADKLLALEAVLLPLGQRLVRAQSGQEALRHLLREDFAVILLDVKMPTMDGFETAELIRRRPRCEKIPIIFITAYGEQETDASRGYSLGAVDYIYTPVVPAVLCAKVRVFIDLFEKNRQVQDLRLQAEQRAQSLELRLESLLNRLDVGVFRTRLDGAIVEANPAFWRLIGQAPTTTPPLMMSDVFDDRTEHDQLVERLLGEGQVQGVQVCWRRGSEPVWVSLTGTLADGVDGQRYADGIVENITPRKEAEALLARKAAELARSNASLEEFAYAASHDLQEPLRTISSYATVLDARYEQALDDRGRKYLGYVVDGAERMQTLIRDLLGYARVGHGERPMQMVACDQVVEDVLLGLRAAIIETGATIEREPLPPVCGDPVLVGQVFQNLISNALKFRQPTVPPRIHISGQRQDDGTCAFAISDNGIGIDPQFHQRVFGVFQRLHARKEFPGSGIGLALCRKVVEWCGGRIWVESKPGNGCTFRFILPAWTERAAEPVTARTRRAMA